MADRAVFLAGQLGRGAGGTSFDLVLSNPPYIEAADVAGLMPEVARYEPLSALAGGADGLEAYRAIIAALPAFSRQTGWRSLNLAPGKPHLLEHWRRQPVFPVPRGSLSMASNGPPC